MRECPKCHNVHQPVNCGVGAGGLQEWLCQFCTNYRWKEFRGTEIRFSRDAIYAGMQPRHDKTIYSDGNN